MARFAKAKFIAQVMSGDLTVQQAEDIGGAELSYAEVKAIASGNPAVLTLAEADAELKRLAVLKKHHADEQYLARRALRELPETIARQERRLSGLAQDLATAEAHADDPLTIGASSYSREQATEALAARLKTLPVTVPAPRYVPLGRYRGLAFGIRLYPGLVPEAYAEGVVTRLGKLSREHHGPRAVLNAVERLVAAYAGEHDKAIRELEITQGQLRDYTARRDGAFPHAAYLEALTALRDALEAALSNPQEAPNIHTLVEQFKALKAAHTLEAAPERRASRKAATLAESVTTRILQRTGTFAPFPAASDAMDEKAITTADAAETPTPPVTTTDTATLLRFTPPLPAVHRPKSAFRQRATQDKRQMSLF